MAVNYADGMLFGSVLIYPCTATYTAYHAGVRGMLPCFFAVGLLTGIYYVAVSRALLYLGLDFYLQLTTSLDESRWKAVAAGIPFMLFYLASPPAIIVAGMFLISRSSWWAASTLAF